MADKIISATLKVNTGTSATDIGNVNKQLGKTTEELGNATEGGKETSNTFTTLKDNLAKVPGPLKGVTSGVESVNTALKALAANPIVLVVTILVAALVALYKAFASTEAGAEKIEQIMSGLSAAFHVIADRILKIAAAVVDFFKGNFKQAIEEGKAAVTGMGDAIVAAYTKSADATRRLQEAQDELNRSINVNRAKLERDLAGVKELISDTTASYKERKAAVEEVREAQEKQAAQELANSKKVLLAKYDLLQADQNSADKRDDFAKAQADFYSIQAQQAADRRTLNKAETQIELDNQQKLDAASKLSSDAKKQQLADELAAQKLLAEQQKQATENFLKFVNDGTKFRQQQAKDQQEQDEKDQKDRDDYQKQQDDKEYAAVVKNIKRENDAKKKQADDEKKLADFRIQTAQSVGNALGALADLIGRQTIAGKAFAIAQATINTWLGVTEILSTKSLLPEPLATINRIASITAVIAAGLSAVRNIVKVSPSGGGSADAGGSVSAPAAPAPVAPTQTGTAIDQDSIRGIGNAVSGRSYVLSQDVSHDQDRNERLNRAARLGG